MFGDLAKALSGQGPLNWDAARQFAGLAATGGDSRDEHRSGGAHQARRTRPDRRAARARPHRLRRPSPEVVPVTPASGRSARSRRTARCSPSWPPRSASRRRRPADERRSRRRPDDGDDGQPQQDDGAVDDGHGGGLDGRAHGARRPSASTTCRSRAETPAVTVLPTNIDRFAQRVEHRRRRDAHVGAGPGAHRARAVLHHLAARDFASLVRRHVGGLPTGSRSDRREARSLESDDADPMQAMQQAVQRSGGAARRGAVARATRSSSRRSTLPPPPSSATSTTWSTACRCASSAATRCGSPRPSAAAGSSTAPTTCTSSACSGCASPTIRCSAARTSSPGVVDRVGEARLSVLLARPKALPTPAEIDAPGLWVARLELADDLAPAARRGGSGRRSRRRGATPTNVCRDVEHDGHHADQPDGQEPDPTRECRRPRDTAGDRPRQLEAGLELGERPALVGMRERRVGRSSRRPSGRLPTRS